MCSTPKMPSASNQEQETIATPTAADASVSKASKKTKDKAASLNQRNIKTTARGLTDEAITSKKGLLGE